MGKLEGLRTAPVFERGVYLQPGQYLLEIEKCLVKGTRKSGDGFIVEFKVKESTDTKAHPVGSKATWFQGLRDKDVGFGSIKTFLYAVLGYDFTKDKATIEKEVDPLIEKLADSAIDENSLAGKHVRVHTYMKKTAGKGLDFTVHNWMPVNVK